MLALGFTSGKQNPIELGVVNDSHSELADQFIATLKNDPLFNITEGSEEVLRAALIEGDSRMVLILPAAFQNTESASELRLLVDLAQMRQINLILPVFEKALLAVERKLRDTEPLFSLAVEDVKARSQGYIDFLLPGLLAFTLMQISISGSGFNLVEYRRKGILKRLFVTPVQPRDFIMGLVLARLLLCVVQLSVLLGIAVLFLGATVVGDFASLYFVIVLGTVVFLCLGFCLGSIAKTQQAIMALGNLFIFPQVFLSGIFFPIESLPELIQPLATLLPLSFVVNALRDISNNGLSLLEILPQLQSVSEQDIYGRIEAGSTGRTIPASRLADCRNRSPPMKGTSRMFSCVTHTMTMGLFIRKFPGCTNRESISGTTKASAQAQNFPSGWASQSLAQAWSSSTSAQGRSIRVTVAMKSTSASITTRRFWRCTWKKRSCRRAWHCPQAQHRR
jgi:ABC-2 type transport system permease protein